MRAAFRPPSLSLAGVLVWVLAATATASPPGPREVRKRFHALLDRPAVPLAPVVSRTAGGAFVLEHGRFTSEPGQQVPFLIVRPARAAGRLPAVIVLHGTGGDKEGMRGTCQDLAGRGMLAMAIDARYHGERVAGGAHGSDEYQAAILRAWREPGPRAREHPWFYDTVYDLWRTVDHLQSRDDVDARRIGMIGFSMGGIQTWLAAATDERIAAAVPAIGVQSLRWSLENGQWQGRARTITKVHEAAAKEMGKTAVDAEVCRAVWRKIVPGITDEFDCPSMLRAIAPRPLLILNGELDPNCPLEGAKLAFGAAREAYGKRGAAHRLKIDVAAGIGHAVTPGQRELAYRWLETWLTK
jgi:dienelactone hydrolase